MFACVEKGCYAWGGSDNSHIATGERYGFLVLALPPGEDYAVMICSAFSAFTLPSYLCPTLW